MPNPAPPAPLVTVRTAPAPLAPPRAVVRLAPGQARPAAAVLARAFHEDPVFRWALPDEDRRARALPGIFRTVVRAGLRQGLVHAAPGLEGAAVWVSPGNSPVPMAALLRAGFASWPLRLGPRTFGKLVGVIERWDELHARNAPGLHWYLWVLGVDPPRQGQGLGGRLVHPILERADAQGIPCYLETTQPRNLAFYRRLGFEVVDEEAGPGGGPTFWTMRREPLAARRAAGPP